MPSVLDPFGVKKDFEKKVKDAPLKEQPNPDTEQKDETDYKSKYERFAILDTPEFDELLPVILEEEGEDVSIKIKRVANGYKESKAKLGELTEKEKERETWFRENKITHSREFQENYDKPLKENLNLYNALLGESDKEGKPRREEAWIKFRETIFNKGQDLTPAQIKAINKAFTDQYHQKYGEAPELPSIKEIMDAREEVIFSQASRLDALTNWEKKTELRRAEITNKQTADQEEIKKAKAIENAAKYQNFKKRINYDELQDFFDKDKVDSTAEEMRQEFEDAMSGKKAPQLEEYFEMLHKAKLFDELYPKAKEYKSIVDEIKDGRKPIGEGNPPKQQEEKEESGTLSKFFRL